MKEKQKGNPVGPTLDKAQTQAFSDTAETTVGSALWWFRTMTTCRGLECKFHMQITSVKLIVFTIFQETMFVEID